MALQCKPRLQPITESYCRWEYKLSFACHLFYFASVFVFPHVFVYFSPNAYSLPLNCYIVFLHPESFKFAWQLNYVLLSIAIAFTGIFFMSFAPLPLLLMNQSCWLIDVALCTVEQMNEDLWLVEDLAKPVCAEKTSENLSNLIDDCGRFFKWQNGVQNLLRWNFNMEFQIQSLILCLSVYVFSTTQTGVLVVLIPFLLCLLQLYAYCWMGTRIATRIDKLSYELSKNWHLMKPSQRKTAQMILHWTQNVPGFRGIFRVVSLETFKSVTMLKYCRS